MLDLDDFLDFDFHESDEEEERIRQERLYREEERLRNRV